MPLQQNDTEEVAPLLRFDVDASCGLLKVFLTNSAIELDALHVAFFLDRAVEARWGERIDASEFDSEAMTDALLRFRAAPGWGDVPEGVSESDSRTLDRLVATPLWECAIRLSNTLVSEALRSDGCRPKRILELGAGLGVPGFLSARLWPEAHVAVTECSDSLLELLRRNLQFNFPCSAPAAKRSRSCRTLLAGNLAFGSEAAKSALAGLLHEFGGPIDLIVVSDCFFYPWYGDTWTPLQASLLELCSDATLVLLGVKYRQGGHVAEALDFLLKPPFYSRLLLRKQGQCSICHGNGYIESECCWSCEGVDLKDEAEEVWLMAKSKAALSFWKSGGDDVS